MAANATELKVGTKRVPVSNLDKVLYPEVGFTKGQVIEYYIRIAPVLLPHLKDRAVTLKRYPNGIREEFFYEKSCPSHRPGWVNTAPIWSEGRGAVIQFCLLNDLPTLVWAANLANLELHTSLAKAKDPDKPTMLVFDLDPGEPATLQDCLQVALWLRPRLEEMGLRSFPKTTGSKGLQLYVPLNSKAAFPETKSLAHDLAQRLEREQPDNVISVMSKAERRGKVFIDWSQNDRHKTTVCVYSLRGKERPTISTPLSWEEVDRAHREKLAASLVFLPEQVYQRVDRQGDLFEPVLKLKQKFPVAASAAA